MASLNKTKEELIEIATNDSKVFFALYEKMAQARDDAKTYIEIYCAVLARLIVASCNVVCDDGI